LIKETCRRIRVARSLWDAHNNRACRGEREKALAIRDAERGRAQEGAPGVARLAALPEREVFWCGPDAAG
jgi:hypothetical protein